MDEYVMTTITLKVGDDTSLAILLHNDGTINRNGDGTINIDKTLFMGITNKAIFNELMKYVTEDFKKFLGKIYDVPDKQGKICSIEIVIAKANEGNEMKFIYGSDSAGPPKPVADFVEAAISITDPWFYEQQKKLASRTPKKKWWQFWGKAI
jgi:hypothetical protein